MHGSKLKCAPSKLGARPTEPVTFAFETARPVTWDDIAHIATDAMYRAKAQGISGTAIKRLDRDPPRHEYATQVLRDRPRPTKSTIAVLVEGLAVKE